MKRGGVDSTADACEQIRAIGNGAVLNGTQSRAKSTRNSRKKGKNATDVVRILAGRDSRGRIWNLFVRGKVLLTVHGPY